jgi:hypothetical protein
VAKKEGLSLAAVGTIVVLRGIFAVFSWLKETRGRTGWAIAAALSLCFVGGCADSSITISSTQPSLSGGRDIAPVSSRYFGMHITDAAGETPWPVVPFGTWRLWDAYVTWKDLEPSKGIWNFAKLDALVALAAQHNAEIILPFALTPQWASARPYEPSAYTPGAAAEPSSIQDWIDYVQVVTTRYKGKIAYYEMWNEANSTTTWTGTPTELVLLQQAAYSVMKSNDPNAKLISVNLESTSGLPYMENLLRLGYADSADIIGFHLYVSPGVPEDIAPLAAKILSLLNQHEVSKPLWDTETGWLPGCSFASEDQQAATAVRALLVANTSGAARFLWYAWDNHCCVTLFMTERDDTTPTRAALAYANLEKWLVGNTLSPCTQDRGLWSCGLQFRHGGHGLILWKPSGTASVVDNLDWAPTVVEDMYGNDSPMTGRSLKVGEDPVLLRE